MPCTLESRSSADVERERGGLVDPRRPRAHGPDHLRPSTLDAERVERVVGERGDAFGIGGQRQAERTGSGLGERGHETAVRAPSLVAGDLLFEDHRDQALGDQTGARDPQARVSAPEVPHQPRRGVEPGVVVLGAAPGGGPVEHPGRARPPRLGLDPARDLGEPDRHRSVGRPRRPFGDAPRGPHRRIPASALHRSQRLPEGDRALGREVAARHVGQATPCDANGRPSGEPAVRRTR